MFFSKLTNFIFIISMILISKISFAKDIYFISDIDDTIKISAIKAGKIEMFKKIFVESNAFLGMDSLYRFIDKHEIYYVSGSPGPVSILGYNFLYTYNFPLKSDYYFMNKEVYENTLEFKVKSIKEIIESNTEAYFVLIGDNGEYDAKVYKEIENLFPGRVISFIRTVYAGKNDTIINYSDSESLENYSIYKSQTPYFTSADLAVQFFNLGYISKENLLNIVNEFLEVLNPINSNAYKSMLVHEKWMSGCKGYMNSAWDHLVTESLHNDTELLNKMNTIKLSMLNFEGCKIK